VDLPRALAQSLRQMREEAGLTQAEMARALGISRPTLTRLENAGQNVTLRTLAQLCRTLGCSVGDLFVAGKVKLRARRG
jgi:putative transcriptional regulator